MDRGAGTVDLYMLASHDDPSNADGGGGVFMQFEMGGRSPGEGFLGTLGDVVRLLD